LNKIKHGMKIFLYFFRNYGTFFVFSCINYSGKLGSGYIFLHFTPVEGLPSVRVTTNDYPLGSGINIYTSPLWRSGKPESKWKPLSLDS